MDEKVEHIEPYGFGVRHIQAVLSFSCLTVAFIMRVDMSVAIIAMTDKSGNITDQIFNWDKQIQDVILSSFFWGYMAMQIPAGYLAHRYGPKLLLLIAMLANGLTTLIIPWGANLGGWKVVCACRAIQGLTQASVFPGFHTFISKWFPNSERSRLSNLIFTGTPLGTIIGLPLCSILASTSYGWPCLFYVVGTLGILMGLMWQFCAADSPEKHPRISEKEKYYIETSLGNTGTHEVLKTPWKSFLTSLPLFAVAAAHTGCNWGFLTLLVETPSYLKHTLGIDMKRSGMLSALPYIAMWMGSILMSFISDYVVNKKIFTPTFSRKFFNTIGTWIPAIGLIILGYVPAGNEFAAIAMITMIVGLSSGMNMGFILCYVDMAPNFAGPLVSITNCIANGVGILAPITVGLILNDHENPAEWRKVFIITSLIYFFSNLFFVIFATSEKQSWNEPQQNESIETGDKDTVTAEEKELMLNHQNK